MNIAKAGSTKSRIPSTSRRPRPGVPELQRRHERHAEQAPANHDAKVPRQPAQTPPAEPGDFVSSAWQASKHDQGEGRGENPGAQCPDRKSLDRHKSLDDDPDDDGNESRSKQREQLAPRTFAPPARTTVGKTGKRRR